MKNIIIILIVLILVVLGGYFWMQDSNDAVVPNDDLVNGTTTPNVNELPVDKTKTVLGTSVEGRNITAYQFGEGNKEVLFVGGIHGGYEWNTVLVAYEFMDWLKANPEAIPANLKVTVVPVMNPDGLNKTVGTAERFTKADVPATQAETVSGRFNANNVDLNRNFDCDWQATGKWQNTNVSGGTGAFSEPESLAIKNYVDANNPVGAVVWYSSAGGVFSSNCHNGVSAETLNLTNDFAKASGYPAYKEFNFYEITGDMVNWLAKENIPAISVLLTDHQNTEWSKNEAGIKAVFSHFAE